MLNIHFRLYVLCVILFYIYISGYTLCVLYARIVRRSILILCTSDHMIFGLYAFQMICYSCIFMLYTLQVILYTRYMHFRLDFMHVKLMFFMLYVHHIMYFRIYMLHVIYTACRLYFMHVICASV